MKKQSSITTETSSFDTRCSSACTRAGLAALLLAAAAISLLQPLEKAKAFKAVREYVQLRLFLEDTLNDLYADPCWSVVINNGMNERMSKEWDLAKLMKYKCKTPFESIIVLGEIESSNRRNKSHDENQPPREKSNDLASPATKPRDFSPPAPPSGIALERNLWQVYAVTNILIKLCDDNLLTLARSYSSTFDLSIWRWENLRLRLLAQSMGAPIIRRWKKGDVLPARKSPSPLIISPDKITRLTLEKVNQIAGYELPDLVEIESLSKEQNRFSLPSIHLPLGILALSIFLQFGLCFTILYFWLFQREAKQSSSFPAPGTLFGVFTRSATNHGIFLTFLSVPAIAAGLLGFRSLSLFPFNILLGSIVLIFSVIVAWEFPKSRQWEEPSEC